MSTTEQYVTPQSITKLYGVSSTTLRNWAEDGKIKFIRPHGGRRLYDKEDVSKIFEQPNSNQSHVMTVRKRILYARVSSPHQAEDLNRQIEFLRATYPHDQVITDIGSGLNWKRNGWLITFTVFLTIDPILLSIHFPCGIIIDNCWSINAM